MKSSQLKPGYPLYQTYSLIIYFVVNVNTLIELGKQYSWPRLKRCLVCGGSRVWGHGYVRRFFDGTEEALWLKRYRCPDCSKVYTVRPKSHYRNFWASRITILKSIFNKLIHNSWITGVSRQRQQYWFKGFKLQAMRHETPRKLSVDVLLRLYTANIIVVTHSLKYFESESSGIMPYRRLALTASAED